MKRDRKTLLRRSKFFNFFAGWGFHVFFQTSDGRLWGCGYNKRGQLGMGKGSLDQYFSPVIIEFFDPKVKRGRMITKVSLGYSHTVFQTERGTYSCGSNTVGQCSVVTLNRVDSPENVSLADDSKKITEPVAGYSRSYFICSGLVFSSGGNAYGELGLGGKKDRRIAERIHSLTCVIQVITGANWAMFLSSNGDIHGCGNNYDQFPGKINPKLPLLIDWFQKRNIKISFLVSAFKTAYFITDRNQVYCAGSTSSGEYGNGQKKNLDEFFHNKGKEFSPVLSIPLSGFDIFCSGKSSDFIVFKKNGKVWGSGTQVVRYGAKQPIIRDNRYKARVIESLATLTTHGGSGSGSGRIVQIVTRNEGTFAICRDGTVFSAGQGTRGENFNTNGATLREFTRVGKFKLKRAGGWGDEEQAERLEFLMGRYSVLCTGSILFVELWRK